MIVVVLLVSSEEATYAMNAEADRTDGRATNGMSRGNRVQTSPREHTASSFAKMPTGWNVTRNLGMKGVVVTE